MADFIQSGQITVDIVAVTLVAGMILWSAFQVVLLLFASILIAVFLAAPPLADQIRKLGDRISQGLASLQATVLEYERGRRIAKQTPSPQDLAADADIIGRLTTFFSTTAAAITSLIIFYSSRSSWPASPACPSKGSSASPRCIHRTALGRCFTRWAALSAGRSPARWTDCCHRHAAGPPPRRSRRRPEGADARTRQQLTVCRR